MPGDIIARLRTSVLVCEGAMGTLLMSRGAGGSSSAEANLTHPEMVAQIHRDYHSAGAQVFQTNTFAANPLMLERVGLLDRGPEIWSAAVRLCREAAGPEALVGANIGPTGGLLAPLGDLTADDAGAAFRRQLEAMLGPQVDFVLFESFESLDEIELAIKALRGLDTRIPAAATMSFSVPNGRTSMGVDGAAAAARLGELNVQIIGASCGTPPGLELAFSEMAERTELPLMAQPNDGLPEIAGGKTIWRGTPAEAGELAARLIACGARIVGGCCGSTPDHILQVARAASAGA